MKKLSFLLFLALITSICNAQCDGRYDYDAILFDSLTLIPDVVYGQNTTSDDSLIDLHVDIYTPFGDTVDNRPLIIFAHGGSFIGGSRKVPEATLICKEFARRGYVAASVQYRIESNPLALLSRASMIKAVMRATEDVRASVRFFRKDFLENSNRFGIDPDQIFLGGSSAGSIACLHHVYLNDAKNELNPEYYAYAEQTSILDNGEQGNSGNLDFSSEVVAVINVSGALAERKYMDDNTTPILSVHSVGDLAIPYGYGKPYFLPPLPIISGSSILHARAQEVGIYSELYEVDGFVHVPYKDENSQPAQPVYDSTITAMTKFAYKFLKCNAEDTLVAQDSLTTGVKNQYSKSFNLFPNPSSHQFQLTNTATNNLAATITISSLDRRKLLTKSIKIHSKTIKIDHNLTKGIYILNVSDSSGKSMFKTKLIVQN